jgi:hypothetical protein
MFLPDIKTELLRLQLHPVNLDALAEEGHNVVLKGSLLEFWAVPQLVDGAWFLGILKTLPNNAGPKVTMDAFYAACSAKV